MLVVNDYTLYRLERDINNVLDLLKAFVGIRLASRLLKVESQVVYRPFRAVLLIVLIRILLNSDVRQVRHFVVNVTQVITILLVAESGKAERAQPDLERPVTGDEYVNT